METLYGEDLAWVQARGFGGLARGAAPHIVALLRGAAVHRVVEIGCGAGPLTASLTAAGFDVTAIEPSPALLELARVAAPAARFVRGSAYGVTLPPCEAVVAFGEPLTYHPDPAAAPGLLRGFFRAAAEILPSGGLLLFDLIATGLPLLDARFWTADEDWAVLAETREDPAAATLARDIQVFRRTGSLYRRSSEVHRIRLFEPDDVCNWLAAAGFHVETAAAYGAQPLPPRRVVFTATRVD